MTYNIKLDYPKEGENSWTERKEFVLGQIQFYEPDIFGIQEALLNQMQYLIGKLENYNYVGLGRDGEDKGEYSAIFYRKDKFNVSKTSTFWLSKTPEKPSLGWDARFNRICAYGLFYSKSLKSSFWVYNTHLDHEGEIARNESLKLIVNRIGELNSDELPVVIMGDFNLEPEAEALKFLKSKFFDSKEVSMTKPFGPDGTFNGFEFHKPVTRRIDYIFVSEKIKTKKHAVLSDSQDCKYPSDHFPVYAELLISRAF